MSNIGSSKGKARLDPIDVEESKEEEQTTHVTKNITIVQQSKQLRIKVLDTFNSTKLRLKRFFMQCDLYFRILSSQFEDDEDKGMFAAALLRDAVGDQVEPYVRDRIDYKTANQRVDTQIMFNSQEAFKQAMEHMFRDPNKERKAV